MTTAQNHGDPETFWTRQFASRVTASQVLFDLISGIALPLICLWFDPIVFQSNSNAGPALLGEHQFLAYCGITLGMATLLAWHLFHRLGILFAGALTAFALASLVLGLILLPFSLLGLVVVVGVLGFSPFLTAFAFWRNSVRASASISAKVSNEWRWALGTAGFFLALIGPVFLFAYADHHLTWAADHALSDNPEESARAVALLRHFGTSAYTRNFLFLYDREDDPGRRQRIAEVYRQFAGQDIEAVLDQDD
jgi:hypothetical protein